MLSLSHKPKSIRMAPGLLLALAGTLMLAADEAQAQRQRDGAQRPQNGAQRPQRDQQARQGDSRNARSRFQRGRWRNWRPPNFRPPFQPPENQPPAGPPVAPPPSPDRPSTIFFVQRGAYLADFTVSYEEYANGEWTPRTRNWYNIPVNQTVSATIPGGIRNVRIIGEAYVFIGTKGTIFNRTYRTLTGSTATFVTTGTTLNRSFTENVTDEFGLPPRQRRR